MIGEVLKKTSDVGGSIAKEASRGAESFDPDKRLSPDRAKINAGEKTAESYDPDKSLEVKSDSLELTRAEKKELNGHIKDYTDDLIKYSDYPETLKGFKIKDLQQLSKEQVKEVRKEFKDRREGLIKEWEKKYGVEWPRYAENIYDKNGIKIREAGQSYDAHHKIPLSVGGKNEVDNITPMRADIHYDHSGIHAKDSACSSIQRIVKNV